MSPQHGDLLSNGDIFMARYLVKHGDSFTFTSTTQEIDCDGTF